MSDLYLRLSEDKHGDTLGVQRQEEECRALAERLGLTVERVHTDNDISATTGAYRPGFEALLTSKPKAIITWHLDRLCRRNSDLERVISLDVPVHTVSAGYIDLSNPAGRAVARTIAAWSTYEGDQKSARQKAAARQRAASGKPWWSSRPFGYEMNGNLRAVEANALRDAYTAVLMGTSLRTICKRINADGLSTCRGNAWRPETLGPVLRNPRNAGLRQYDGQIVGEAGWEAIVSEDVWRAVTGILNDPARISGQGRAPSNLLTGFARCSKCLSAVKKSSRPQYTCRANHCVNLPIRLVDDVVVGELLKAWAKGDVRPPQAPEAGKELTLEAAALRRNLDDLAVKRALGEITISQFEAADTAVKARLKDIESQLNSLTVVDYDDLEALSEDWDDKPLYEQRDLVRRFVKSVTLVPTGKGRRPGPGNVRVEI